MRALTAAVLGLALIGTACTEVNGSTLEEEPQAAELETGLYSGPQIETTPHPFGVKWRWDLIDDIEDEAIEVAGGASYAELEWCEIERKPGEQDWERADDVISSTLRIGYEPLVKIRVGTCWATGKPDVKPDESTVRASRMPVDLGAYQQFVAQLVTRYSREGVSAYAIESEVNLSSFWRGTPEEYELLARTAADAIRTADPSARVLDSGLSSTVYGILIADARLRSGNVEGAINFWNSFYERWFEFEGFKFVAVDDKAGLREQLSTSRAQRDLDYWAVTTRLADTLNAFNLRFFERWGHLGAVVRFAKSKLPADHRIEAWDVGIAWPGDDFDEEEIRIEVAKLLAVGSVLGLDPMIYQPGANEAAGLNEEAEVFRGLWRAPGLTRPAGQAFAIMVAAARGDRVKTRAIEGLELQGVAYGHPDRAELVIWSSDAPVRLDGVQPDSVEVHDLAGEEVEWEEPGLIIGAEPYVITVDEGLAAGLELIDKRETPRAQSAF